MAPHCCFQRSAMRPSSGLQRWFEPAIHYINIDKSTPGVAETVRKCPDNLKSQIFPKAQGSFVTGDHEVELDGAKTETFRFLQTVHSHGFTHAAAPGRRRNHEAGIRDMRSEPGLIGFENVSADNSPVG
jgi:hypothetical protein